MYGYVYMIENLINGKKYIGVTSKTPLERFQSHKETSSKRNSAIHKAIKKYGDHNFNITTLDIVNSKDEMFEKEKQRIKEYNTFIGYGYNLTEGGGGITNMSKEMRNKISKSKTGKSIEKLKGREITHEWRVKISRTLGAKTVKCRNLDTGEIMYLDYPTQGKKYGFNPSLICAVIYGNRNHHKRWTFEYVSHANTEETTESKKTVAP